MFLTKSYNIFFSYQRFSARVHIEVNSQFFSLGNNAVHLFIGKIQFMSVFCRPASGTMKIACTGRIHQDQPRNIALMHFTHAADHLCPVKSCLKSKIQCCLFHNMRINFIQCLIYIPHPFGIRILDQFSCSIICTFREILSHKSFCQIHNL